MKKSIFKLFINIGNFLFNLLFYFLIKNFYYLNDGNFYINKKNFFKNIKKKIFFYFITNIFIKYNNFLLFYIINYYNFFIFVFFKLDLKLKLKQSIYNKKIFFYLSEINNFLNYKSFIICCKLENKTIKHYGISIYRIIAENNSYKNLLKTILL